MREYPDLPHHKDSKGRVKLSLAYIIDKICKLKGVRVGGAQVSKHQALVILNQGNATSADIYSLAKKVMTEVEAKTGIIIEPEVQFIP